MAQGTAFRQDGRPASMPSKVRHAPEVCPVLFVRVAPSKRRRNVSHKDVGLSGPNVDMMPILFPTMFFQPRMIDASCAFRICGLNDAAMLSPLMSICEA